jgi:hypothetical protein
MGSTGTGRFTDYPGPRKAAAEAEEEGSTSGDLGEGGDDLCSRVIADIPLEDVERCSYFLSHGSDVPPPGTDVRLLPELVGGRLAVATVSDADVVGYMPTEFNYLRRCMNQGHTYAGEITDSTRSPLPGVHATLNPDL